MASVGAVTNACTATRVRIQASEPMQKVVQHLMGFLKNHLSSEDRAYLR
jgi:uncharacterized protein YbgA (DUF1722 family)